MKRLLVILLIIILVALVCSIPLLLTGLFSVNLESYPMTIEQLEQERLGFGMLALAVILFDNVLLIVLTVIAYKLRMISKKDN